jgi:hypothetical protein
MKEKQRRKATVKDPHWLHTPRVETKRADALRKRIAEGNSFRTRMARLEAADYVTRPTWQRCEKCNAPTIHEVKTMGRWSRWCGCP